MAKLPRGKNGSGNGRWNGHHGNGLPNPGADSDDRFHRYIEKNDRLWHQNSEMWRRMQISMEATQNLLVQISDRLGRIEGEWVHLNRRVERLEQKGDA